MSANIRGLIFFSILGALGWVIPNGLAFGVETCPSLLLEASLVAQNSAPTLSEIEKATIENYTLSGAELINGALRGSVAMTAEIRELIASLDSALAKLPDSPGTFYRVVPFQYEGLYEVGKNVLEKAFTSTDRLDTYTIFGPIVRLRISGRGKDIVSLSAAVGEREVIFPRNTRFLVKNKQRTATGQILIDLEEVGR